MPKCMDTFFITIDVRARYTVNIPAVNKEEATMIAYNQIVPVSSLSDVEKDVVKIVRMTESHGKLEFTIEKC